MRPGTANRSAETLLTSGNQGALNQYLSEQALLLWGCPNVPVAAHTLLFQFFIRIFVGLLWRIGFGKIHVQCRHEGVKISDFNDATSGFPNPGSRSHSYTLNLPPVQLIANRAASRATGRFFTLCNCPVLVLDRLRRVFPLANRQSYNHSTMAKFHLLFSRADILKAATANIEGRA